MTVSQLAEKITKDNLLLSILYNLWHDWCNDPTQFRHIRIQGLEPNSYVLVRNEETQCVVDAQHITGDFYVSPMMIENGDNYEVSIKAQNFISVHLHINTNNATIFVQQIEDR